jgi:hypothetical protein
MPANPLHFLDRGQRATSKMSKIGVLKTLSLLVSDALDPHSFDSGISKQASRKMRSRIHQSSCQTL